MRMLRPCLATAVLVATLAACEQTETRNVSARDQGKELFSEPTASPAAQNVYACATCHVGDEVPAELLLPGAPLGGVVQRPTFWGGADRDLLRSINVCRQTFMGASDPWAAEDADAQALWAYLSSLPAARVDAVPFTVVRAVADLPSGNADAGHAIYDRACKNCHGAAHTGEAHLSPLAVVLPEAPLASTFAGMSPVQQRVAFIEKTRHGAFLGTGGTMPPFSTEVLSDADLANVLTYLGRY